jgi:hypothetical protein
MGLNQRACRSRDCTERTRGSRPGSFRVGGDATEYLSQPARAAACVTSAHDYSGNDAEIVVLGATHHRYEDASGSHRPVAYGEDCDCAEYIARVLSTIRERVG